MDQQTPKPKFGSKEWIVNAILLKYEGTPDRPAETIESVSDYLALKKVEATLWPQPEPKTAFIWIDPPDFPGSEDLLFRFDSTPETVQ